MTKNNPEIRVIWDNYPMDQGATPRAKARTPALDFFGRDLTRAAQEGKLSPLVGREPELQLVIETLLRRTKRNPVLVGPAGVGKTAIVEGLAQSITAGRVPELLRRVRLIALQPSALVAGASMPGELESRTQSILAEASQEGIILFIDEVHALVGAGGTAGTGDLASQLKPALTRGDLACIAATTDEEYRRFIEPDGALERRFQPVRVEEPTLEQTLLVLERLGEDLARLRKVEIARGVLPYLVHFADEYLRNRQFPDKAVDLLEQCVAHALAQNKHVVDQADAEAVAQRTVGMPLALTDRLGDLAARLAERGLLPPADIETLVDHLQVTLTGLNLRPVRPDAVVLLTGPTAANRSKLAETIAEILYGSGQRVVAIDFGRFANPGDLSLLVGAPPGYVGYSDVLPMHRVADLGWCVLLGTNLHLCHPQVREVLTQALASGYLTESRGRRIYLSNAVVLLAADLGAEAARLGGLGNGADAEAVIRQITGSVLGETLIDQCDLIVTVHGKSAVPDKRRWLQDHLAADLWARYRERGIDLRYDESVVDWLLARAVPVPAQAPGSGWWTITSLRCWLAPWPSIAVKRPGRSGSRLKGTRYRLESLGVMRGAPQHPCQPQCELSRRRVAKCYPYGEKVRFCGPLGRLPMAAGSATECEFRNTRFHGRTADLSRLRRLDDRRARSRYEGATFHRASAARAALNRSRLLSRPPPRPSAGT
jgi:ATP-dependent Clp protease ATP-binding subunit ClpC